MPERYLSPAMHDHDALSLIAAPLVGVEARAYNDIWNAVIDRKLRPGTKLEEGVLCEIYGVSRTVIRKVLVIMEQEGIVSLPLNRGAYIALPSPQDAADLCEAASALLSYIVGQLADNPSLISAAQRDNLTLHLQARDTAAAAGDFHTARRLSMEYGTLLALIYGNTTIAATYERYVVRFALAQSAYQYVFATGSSQFVAPLTLHILAGDKQAAQDLIETAWRAALKGLRFDLGNDAPDLKSILGSSQQS
jgi:DNA-binding GntR family transcriptional regulator